MPVSSVPDTKRPRSSLASLNKSAYLIETDTAALRTLKVHSSTIA